MRILSTIKLICCILTCLFMVACQGQGTQTLQSPYKGQQALSNKANMPIANAMPTHSKEPMRGPLNP